MPALQVSYYLTKKVFNKNLNIKKLATNFLKAASSSEDCYKNTPLDKGVGVRRGEDLR